ncbi:SDR family oxidoreductase [Micromonospora sp. NPDC049891]|uniref:SDR family oxidoreductase n=1 Tax=Micromonospora sp. NPDC049891 TaxID=3155655 RepID=UPI0034007347
MEETVVITGASRGIGLATASYLAARGVNVIGLARRAPEQDFPGKFHNVDLTDQEEAGRILMEIAATSPVTGLVNNVGMASGESLDDLSLETLHAVLALNVRIAVQATAALVPGMRRQGFGRIINVASVVALGAPNRTSYSAAKAAMLGMTKSWALELATDRITVNAVAPGPIETEFFRSLNPPGSTGESNYLKQIPVGRLGKPDEIATAIFFLIKQSGFITGQTLYVDGGWSIGRQSI